MSRTCPSCAEPLPANARFCTTCGAATRQHTKAVQKRHDAERRAFGRSALALGIVCSATLFGILGGALWLPDGATEWTWSLVGAGIVFASAIVAGAVGGVLRASAPLVMRWPWLLAAVPAAAFTFLASVIYVDLLASPSLDGDFEVPVAVWVSAVVFAPLGEEWLCRGVAWQACRRMTSVGTTLILTSIVFAFLHGLGGHLLALPHRFVAGLVFGWLRARSGSLSAGIAAHALHNFAAVTWFDG